MSSKARYECRCSAGLFCRYSFPSERPEDFSLPTLTPTHLGCLIVAVLTHARLLYRVGLFVDSILFRNWTKW